MDVQQHEISIQAEDIRPHEFTYSKAAVLLEGWVPSLLLFLFVFAATPGLSRSDQHMGWLILTPLMISWLHSIVWRMIFSGPALVVFPTGLYYEKYAAELIPWSKIESIRRTYARRSEIIGIGLERPFAESLTLRGGFALFKRLTGRAPQGFAIIPTRFNGGRCISAIIMSGPVNVSEG